LTFLPGYMTAPERFAQTTIVLYFWLTMQNTAVGIGQPW
jgi:hypothetical protein